LESFKSGFGGILFQGIGMIEGIRLRNWKTHLDSSFEFGKGTNVLVGKMGSGKTSVMDAICFALFGTFPSLNARKLSLEEVIMSKPQVMEDAFVELGFSYGGKKYRVERRIKKKGSTEAKIFCDERLIAGPKPRDVNAAVEKAIEINYNLFSRAVYSEQNEIDNFLRLTPRERKAKFDELLDLERYEKVRANAVTALNRVKDLAKDKARFAEEQRASLDKGQESELKKRVEGKEKEIEAIEKSVDGKRKGLGEKEREVEELEKQEKRFRQVKEAVAEKKAALKEVEKAVEETKRECGKKGLREIEEEEKKSLEELKESGRRLEETKKVEKEARLKKEALGKKAALGERRVEELGRHLKELEGLGPKCPVCRQKLEEKTRAELLGETREGIKKATLEMESALKEEALENSKIKKTGNEIELVQKKRELLNEELIKTRHLLDALKKLAEKEKKVKGLREEIEKLESELKETKFDEETLLVKRKQLVEEKALIESTLKEIESGKALVKELRARLEAIEKARNQIVELEKSVKEIEKASEKMSYFVNSLLATQAELRETLIATINEEMHDIWHRIYPYRDFVSAKMHVEEGSYELRVKERIGNWVRVEGILSGGERSAAAICIRIAFSLVLTRNLRWLILDEPTHNLDATAVEKLGGMMQLHLPGIIEQVFVITHDKEMKKAASASLYVLEREKDEDAVTRPVLVQAE
jgi:exonuclease SbcC